MSAVADERLARARACAASVPDPEIPVVTLDDLGILRDVRDEGGRVVVELTPTYTGCPATRVIADDVRRALADGGFADAEVRMVLAPPWSTDWISADGRRKLRAYGIAPPGAAASAGVSFVRLVPRAGETAGASARGASASRPAPALAGVSAETPFSAVDAHRRAPSDPTSGTAVAAAVAATASGDTDAEIIECPRCGSADVERLSQHGSTPCKALYRCVACREPFDYFKPY
ncbi:MAG: phenylacetate-CoA oxygenase subunit PaaJ [Burkholderiaceae bacterium]|nr:phenylacetate-CoA oxygenase subunit PaaJ [Burkholderiaceae bacterium]